MPTRKQAFLTDGITVGKRRIFKLKRNQKAMSNSRCLLHQDPYDADRIIG